MSLVTLHGLPVYEESIVTHDGTTFFLARDQQGEEKLLGVVGDTRSFAGSPHPESGGLLCPLTPENAAVLRSRLPWLQPVPLALRTSAGMGDRLGLATPGHVQAVRGTGLAPIFAQQSVRENNRTGRSPQQVLDDAMWGVFQEGWREPWGADADHLKTPAAVPAFVVAGYSFFTVDPGDHVDNSAETATVPDLAAKVGALPWDVLESSPRDLEQRYLGSVIHLDGFDLSFSRGVLLKAAAKYGQAVAHTVTMEHHIHSQMGAKAFDFEVSVDETALPTSTAEHFYIASELQRLKVSWVSLAPRYVGRFEKGVDYIGDLAQFEADFARHVAVMRHFGGYKLSLHSGSDKFSVYGIAARLTGGLVHLKTAGTSYLEALRVLARLEPGLFRDILTFARQHYEADRATYHVSASLAKVPASADLSDGQLPDLLDQFDARQVLHVTFGSVLDHFGVQLKAALRAHEDAYTETVRAHFVRHLTPLQPRQAPG
jgi:hypothetical protein